MMTSGRVPRFLPRGLWLGLILAFGLGTASGTVTAADPEALIREGIELRRAGDDSSALKRFQQAYDLGKTSKAIAQVGLAEQALGRWAAADKHLHQALQSGDDPWIRKYRGAIDQALGVVSAHVGRLDVRGIPTGADVRVDGELVGRLPLTSPITVTAGGVAIEVRAPGYLPIARTTNVTAGLLTRESFTLQPLAPAAETPVGAPQQTQGQRSADAGTIRFGASPPAGDAGTQTEPTPPPPDRQAPAVSGNGHRILIMTLAGLSAVSLAFGIVEHLSWQRKVTSFDSMSNCGGSLPDKGSQGCRQLYDDGQHAKVLTFVGYGATAAFAATAVVLYLADPDRASEPQKLACTPIPVTVGVRCGIRF